MICIQQRGVKQKARLLGERTGFRKFGKRKLLRASSHHVLEFFKSHEGVFLGNGKFIIRHGFYQHFRNSCFYGHSF